MILLLQLLQGFHRFRPALGVCTTVVPSEGVSAWFLGWTACRIPPLTLGIAQSHTRALLSNVRCVLLHFPMSGEGESVTSQDVAVSVIWVLYGSMPYSALAVQEASP